MKFDLIGRFALVGAGLVWVDNLMFEQQFKIMQWRIELLTEQARATDSKIDRLLRKSS